MKPRGFLAVVFGLRSISLLKIFSLSFFKSALIRSTSWLSSLFSSWRENRYATWALQLLMSLIFASIISQFNLDTIEALSFDLRLRFRPNPTPSGQIELVLMNQTTVEKLGGVPTYKHYAEALGAIIAQGPRAIVVLPALNRSGDIEDDKGLLGSSPEGPPEEALELAQVLRSFPHLYQLSYKFKLRGQNDDYKLGPPLDFVPVLSFSKSADATLFAKDGVTRRAFVSYQEQPLGPVFLAGLVNGDQALSPSQIRGQFDVYDSRQIFIDFLQPGSFSVTAFERLLKNSSESPLGANATETNAVETNRFTGKIVFIGDDFGKTIKNYVATPHSRDPGSMTALELQAHTVETFIRNTAPVPSPDWVRQLLLLIIAFVTIRIVLSEHPLQGLTHLFLMTFSFAILSYLIFWSTGLLIPMAHPLLGIFLCYYFFIPYRLIMENRKSWEYYQKNQLLKQVEELKTNFISMMSHDLKTPIARIQGMADVITKDTNHLSPPQQEAIDHIRTSSEDLHKFINTILNYARIESEGVALHLQSKDINELIKDVIRKHDFLAKVKHISVVTNFEPLFPIRVDPELIKQVISNLIENAIKYSSDGSQVIVTTRESDAFVRIEVKDGGQGIDEADLPNVFMKFFRSKAVKSSPIKGSGLGLYLAKYFVELHKGQISVQSVQGQGSTFTVDLPLGN